MTSTSITQFIDSVVAAFNLSAVIDLAERTTAAEMAYDALTSLQFCPNVIPRWTRFV
ncbi:MAG: hypothetical protein U0175_39200 [Caldilineaceae bacterium]